MAPPESQTGGGIGSPSRQEGRHDAEYFCAPMVVGMRFATPKAERPRSNAILNMLMYHFFYSSPDYQSSALYRFFYSSPDYQCSAFPANLSSVLSLLSPVYLFILCSVRLSNPPAVHPTVEHEVNPPAPQSIYLPAVYLTAPQSTVPTQKSA